MTSCSHCIDASEHPSFVLLLEAVDESTGEQGTYWEHSQQPLHCLLAHQRRRRYKGAPKATKRFAAHWRMELVVGPFWPARRATQFRTVLQRVCGEGATSTRRRAGAITLARKWVEIEGSMEEEAGALRVYAEETKEDDDTVDAAQSLQLVREAVRVVHHHHQAPNA